jgi:hypothetical protein
LHVLDAYAKLFDFIDLDFDIALRRFLCRFRLPGEAQKIDRIMNAFAQQYFVQNRTDIFSSADTVYILAFSVIMLNTDAHNPHIKKKMTQSEFIRNNRGTNDGKDISTEYLAALYERIVSNEIKMEREMFPDALKIGSVWIRGESLDETLALRKGKILSSRNKRNNKSKWASRWFVLCESGLHLCQDAQLTQPLAGLVLNNCKVEEVTNEEELKALKTDRKHSFLTKYSVIKLTTSHSATVLLGDRVYYLALKSVRDVRTWMSLLLRARACLTSTSALPRSISMPSHFLASDIHELSHHSAYSSNTTLSMNFASQSLIGSTDIGGSSGDGDGDGDGDEDGGGGTGGGQEGLPPTTTSKS